MDRLTRSGNREMPGMLRSDELLADLCEALHRVAAALESKESAHQALGQVRDSRYTPGAVDQNGVVGERIMAELLNIPRRTLADHRRRHRLDGCWTRNGRRYFWNVAATLAAWEKGIG